MDPLQPNPEEASSFVLIIQYAPNAAAQPPIPPNQQPQPPPANAPLPYRDNAANNDVDRAPNRNNNLPNPLTLLLRAMLIVLVLRRLLSKLGLIEEIGVVAGYDPTSLEEAAFKNLEDVG
jgi:hypothetical protein